ncbi:hypothetical protein CP8484711_0980A, partial [Chlamydia psittaci 84-8471/1]
MHKSERSVFRSNTIMRLQQQCT